MILVSIYDKEAEAYFKPFTSATRASAVRELTAAAQDPKSPLATHPDDYHSVVIADFDDRSGIVVPCDHFILNLPRPVPVNVVPFPSPSKVS